MIYTNEIIKKKYEKKLIIKRLLKIVYVPIIAGIILITILAGYKKYVKHENNISILGFRQYVVATGSMEPEYNIGDLIVIRETTKEEIKIGDVINYISETGIDTITHRVVDIIQKDGQTYYKTKGDNNNSVDPELVNYSQVKGILVFKIRIARENARKLYNVPKYEENDT